MNTNNSRNNMGIPRSTIILLGILLALTGAVGLLLPAVLSLALTLSLGWFMLAGGVLWAWFSYKAAGHSLVSWLKPLGLIIAGILMLFYPLPGIAALTLMVAFYLLLDSFASFALSMERRPQKGWFWMFLNALFSLILAMLILAGWPVASALYLGIYVGISLLMDGLMLLLLGLASGAQNKPDKPDENITV